MSKYVLRRIVIAVPVMFGISRVLFTILALAPGGESEFLAAGALITDTESTVDLESLISRFAFGDVKDQPNPADPVSATPMYQP